MKTCLLLLTLCGTQIAFSQKNVHACAAVKIKNNSLKSNTLTPAQIGKSELYDVHFYNLDLTMDNVSTTVSGTVEMHAKTRLSTDSILFELFDDYTISNMKLNGTPCVYKRVKSCISIPCNFAANTDFVVSVSYNGTAPSGATNPLGGGGLTNDQSPSWGNQVTWSLSEPFSAYEWFPCKQSLRDKADSVQVAITVPSACKAGSNGLLQQVVDLGGGKSKYVWKHKHPIDYYLISVAIAEYVDYSIYATPAGAPNPILIQNYIYNNPATLPNFQADIDETGSFINLFSDMFGLYPFHNEKYGHCMAPLGGGMEHQTMTTQGFFNNTLTAHELAHQWWGDHVTCASWADIFLNEGFASYAEYLMLEQLYPGDEVQDMADRHDNIKSQPNGSIWVLDSLDAGRIFSSRLTYDKGAAFVHTLRYMVNDDAQFLQALRNYQAANAFDVGTIASLKAELEGISGVDLTNAFEEWYYGEGFPTYSVKWNLKDDTLLLNLKQTVSAVAVTPFFTNPIDLRFQRSGTTDTIIRFTPGSANANFKIPALGNLTNLTAIDPDNWIINSIGSIIHDFTLIDLVGIDDLAASTDFSVFPNPTQDLIRIETGTNATYRLVVVDMQGKVILNKNVRKSETIDLSCFEKGGYVFEFECEDGSRTVRKMIVKE